MNISHRFKFIWWGAPRCASRQVSSLMGMFNMWVYWDDEPHHRAVGFGKITHPGHDFDEEDRQNGSWATGDAFTHHAAIPSSVLERLDQYLLTAVVRNPYDWAVSCWHAEYNAIDPNYQNYSKPVLPFKEYLLKQDGTFYNNDENGVHTKSLFYNKPVDYPIYFENMVESVLKIPFVQEYADNPEVQNWITSVGRNTKERSWRQNYRPEVIEKNYKEYYDEETASIVYEGKKGYFDMFGYDKDSWK